MPAQVKFTMKKSSAVTIPMSGANGIKKSVCFTTLFNTKSRDLDALHFMCAKLSLPKRVDRFV